MLGKVEISFLKMMTPTHSEVTLVLRKREKDTAWIQVVLSSELNERLQSR